VLSYCLQIFEETLVTHILYIEASPRKRHSASIEVARNAIAAWRESDPTIIVDTLDVWSTSLPEFDGAAMQAKYAGLSGESLTTEQARAWEQIRALAARFSAADVLIIAAPLWNFSIPYKLKHLIDVVTQKDVLFTFDERGFKGLLVDHKALLICARGLDYNASAMTPAVIYDFQKPYLEMWLRFVGIQTVATILVEKTLAGAAIDRAARDSASREALGVVRRWA
jgi:FMN-dependent NADH-azoreductase